VVALIYFSAFLNNSKNFPFFLQPASGVGHHSKVLLKPFTVKGFSRSVLGLAC